MKAAWERGEKKRSFPYGRPAIDSNILRVFNSSILVIEIPPGLGLRPCRPPASRSRESCPEPHRCQSGSQLLYRRTLADTANGFIAHLPALIRTPPLASACIFIRAWMNRGPLRRSSRMGKNRECLG
jgi:hypothetical protein